LVALANTTIGEHLNGMTLAPPGWGAYGDRLLIAKSDGGLVVVDPEEPSVTLLTQLDPFVSDVEFWGEHLYAAAFSDSRLVKVDESGNVTETFAAPCEPDGLAARPGGTLVVGCGNADELYGFDGVDWNLLGYAALNGLWAPTGMVWDGTGTLIVLEDGSALHGYTFD
jgi:hypothetical protein